jgi:hypothetical protein
MQFPSHLLELVGRKRHWSEERLEVKRKKSGGVPNTSNDVVLSDLTAASALRRRVVGGCTRRQWLQVQAVM